MVKLSLLKFLMTHETSYLMSSKVRNPGQDTRLSCGALLNSSPKKSKWSKLFLVFVFLCRTSSTLERNGDHKISESILWSFEGIPLQWWDLRLSLIFPYGAPMRSQVEEGFLWRPKECDPSDSLSWSKVRGVPLVPTIIRGRIYGLFHWGYYDTSCKVKPRKYKRNNSGLIYCSQVWSFLRRALTGPTATIIRNFRFGGESHSLHAQCVVAARDDERNLDLLDVRCITEWASVCWDAKSKSFVKNQV